MPQVRVDEISGCSEAPDGSRMAKDCRTATAPYLHLRLHAKYVLVLVRLPEGAANFGGVGAPVAAVA